MTLATMEEQTSMVRRFEKSRPRSTQRTVGPSEAGTVCGRRLAFKMLGVEPSNTDQDPWPAVVGTAVHTWLEDMRRWENERLGRERWHVSTNVGLPPWIPTGHIDVYDADTKTVIDDKVPGVTSFKKYKANHNKGLPPSVGYQVQGHLYAAGMQLLGFDVEHVAIAVWSRGQIKDAFMWQEPYDEAIVEKTLRRLDTLTEVTARYGREALAMIPTGDAYCDWCPYFVPGITETHEACGGHQA